VHAAHAGPRLQPTDAVLCHAPGGGLQAIVYEVNNTLGNATPMCCRLWMRLLHYAGMRENVSRLAVPADGFAISLPRAAAWPRASVFIAVSDAAGMLLSASFAAPAGCDRRGTGRQLMRMPLLGVKILAAIHWQAALLWLKGLKSIRSRHGPGRWRHEPACRPSRPRRRLARRVRRLHAAPPAHRAPGLRQLTVRTPGRAARRHPGSGSGHRPT